MTAPERPLRADARRNREAVLDAASELFARRGDAVQMDEIAVSAGLGVGTL
jgi:AcrR family transcriptional regulator